MQKRFVSFSPPAPVRALFFCAFLAGALCAPLRTQDASAGDMPLFMNGFSASLPVESYKERQFRSVVRQRYDFSCGSAALSTLLQYHYDLPYGEADVLKAMYALGDKDKILKQGFSLLDMKRYLATVGLRANGFRAPLDKLSNVGIPAIALINNKGYLHFVVVKGVTKDMVLVGDPASGMRVVERKAFEEMWNQILFVVLSNGEQGKQAFNRQEEWNIRQVSGFDAALSDRALASFTVHIAPTPNYFF
jgi:predicted double-glycine peptidase